MSADEAMKQYTSMSHPLANSITITDFFVKTLRGRKSNLKTRIILLTTLVIFLNCTITNAQQWYTLNNGLIGNGAYNRVNALCNDTLHHVLWAGGAFQTTYSGDTINNLGYWDGSNWHPFIFMMPYDTFIGIGPTIENLMMYHDKLIMSRNGTTGNSHFVNEIDIDSNNFVAIGKFNNDIQAMCIYNDTLYVSGRFSAYKKPNILGAPWIPTSMIAKWNGQDFEPVGTGIGCGMEVSSLCVYNGKLIAGGLFECAGGNYCKNIAAWDGSQWSPMGIGIGGPVGNFDVLSINAVCSYNGRLYAGGFFDSSFYVPGQGLVVWDTTSNSWNGVGVKFGVVEAIKVIQEILYVGALQCFNEIYPWNCITTYNDTSWITTGKGPVSSGSTTILTIEEFDSGIYVGGKVKFIGDTPYIYTGFVARYDPTLLPITVSITQQICDGEIYNFNGQLISTTGLYHDTLTAQSGVDSIIVLNLTVISISSSISISNDTLTATGNGAVQWYNCSAQEIMPGETGNTFIPPFASEFAAIFTNMNCIDTTACVTYTGVNELQIADYKLQIYPNPANETVTITAENITEIVLSNLLEEIVQSSKYKIQSNTATIDISKLPRGIYLLRVQTNNGWRLGKVVKE